MYDDQVILFRSRTIVHPERPHRWENPRSQRSYEGGLRSESMPMYDDDLSDGEDVVMMDM